MQVYQPPFDLEAFNDTPAVFLVFARDGQPYLGRTSKLRRRLKRLLGERPATGRLLSLREVAVRVEVHPVASRLAAGLTLYELARLHFPGDYLKIIKLRLPSYVKILLANEFPRTQVTTRLSASTAPHYGPFRTRAAAERFEYEVLDLFQVRRCQEDLAVSPDHPGCIYGEMARCLRPCQMAVSKEEYASEVVRLVHFFESDGDSLLNPIRSARDRASDELDFETAARMHQRLQRIEQVLKLRDDLVTEVRRLNGVAVTPGDAPGFVELRFLLGGEWQKPVEFRVAPDSTGEMVPMDRRLREAVALLRPSKSSAKERTEHLALLARWYHSSWRDGEWLPFSSIESLPYRRLVRAISKSASDAQGHLFEP